MKFKSFFLILILFMILLCCFSTVNASEDADDIAAASAGLGLVDDKDTKYDVIVTNPYTLKATLKSSNGKAIVGKEVKLTFNGKTYTVKTNSKGVASYTIKSDVISKLKAGKTYELKAKYVNDIAKGKIKVTK